MRLLIFLVLIRYGLACKCRIVSQFIIGCRISFSDIPGIGFSYFFFISTCCDKSDGLSQDELRAISSAQIVILHRKSSGKQLK